MLYYRRKLILAIITQAGGHVEKMAFQKLLFLICNKQKKPVYEFVPYKYGCFSFTANADLTAMVKHQQIKETETHWIADTENPITQELYSEDKFIIQKANSFFTCSTDELLRYTYTNFPYYAQNSLVSDRYLPVKEIQENYSAKTTIFTIGYEGISLEMYLNRLIQNNVAMLIDVRKNPLSMKYGFSKTLLSSRCENMGIFYRHIPQVGIESKNRNNLNSRKAYEELFKRYKKETIATTSKYQREIAALAEKYERIALTCFEADHTLCHRDALALAVLTYLPNSFIVEHL